MIVLLSHVSVYGLCAQSGGSDRAVQLTDSRTDRTLLRQAHESWLSRVQTDLTLCYKLGSMQLLHLDLIFFNAMDADMSALWVIRQKRLLVD